MTDTALIGLGSNLGDRRSLLERAVDAVASKLGPLLGVSHWHETAPVGGVADQPFLNGALLCRPQHPPEKCLEIMLEIEAALGRERLVHWGNRTIDLDLLLWDRDGNPLTLDTETLTLPHPRVHERAFALAPACELVPGWVHPGTGRTLADLLADIT